VSGWRAHTIQASSVRVSLSLCVSLTPVCVFLRVWSSERPSDHIPAHHLDRDIPRMSMDMVLRQVRAFVVTLTTACAHTRCRNSV
jgi:hypothetical protein